MPTSTKTAVRRRMTQAALIAEGLRRAQTTDPFRIRFRCPACGHTQCAAELPAERAEHVAQACFGCGQLAEEMKGEQRACLIRVKLGAGVGGGEMTDSFPLADELDDDTPSRAPHAAPGVSPAIPDPDCGPDAESPSEAAPVPSTPFLTDEPGSEA